MARTANRFNAINVEEKVEAPVVSWRVGMYARLSVDHDDRKRESIETQLAIMREYVSAHPELGNCLEYVDSGVSGTHFERPAFQMMLDDVRVGKINCIMVKDLSRFGRDYLETTNYLEVILPFMGVRFISVNDRYDSMDENSSNRDLEIALKNLANDMYAKDISKKIHASVEARRKSGKRISGIPPYGYKNDPNDRKGPYIIDEEAAEVVRLVFSLVIEGYTLSKIPNVLKEKGINTPLVYRKTGHVYHEDGDPKTPWTEAALSRMVRSEQYIGNLVQGKTRKRLYNNEKTVHIKREDWIVTENEHEPIMSEEIFNKAREIVDKRGRDISFSKGDYRKVAKKKNKYAGLLRCGVCGSPMIYGREPDRKTYKKYWYGFSCYRKTLHDGQKGVRLSEMKLDRFVLEKVRELVKEFTIKDVTMEKCRCVVEKKTMEARRRVDGIEAEMAKIDGELFLQYQEYSLGKMSRVQFLHDRQETMKRAEQCRIRLAEAQDDLVTAERAGEEAIKRIKALYRANGAVEVTEEMLGLLVDSITIKHGGKVEIKWRFSDEGCGDIS